MRWGDARRSDNVEDVRGSSGMRVGGLGLGYTAQAGLADARVDELDVIDILEAIIDWHAPGIVPVGPALVDDHRFRLRYGDVCALSGYRRSSLRVAPSRVD